MAEKEKIIDTLDKPKFDFSNVSYKRGRESAKLQARIQHMGKRVNEAKATDDIDDLLKQWDDLMDQQESYITEAIVHIPQSWLLPTAPLTENINWKDRESLQWLRSDKLQELGSAKQDAQNNPN